MKKLCVFFILFLCLSEAWAGKKFACAVELPPDIARNIFYEATLTEFVDIETLTGKRWYTIIIFNTDIGNIFTNIAASELNSYINHNVSGGRVEQIAGRTHTGYAFAGYLSNRSKGVVALWDFVFFDPRAGADITKRNFTTAKCVMTTFHSHMESPEHERVPVVARANRPGRFINENFTNLYEFYDQPDIVRAEENKCFETCKKVYNVGQKIIVGGICCGMLYLTLTGQVVPGK